MRTETIWLPSHYSLTALPVGRGRRRTYDVRTSVPVEIGSVAEGDAPPAIAIGDVTWRLHGGALWRSDLAVPSRQPLTVAQLERHLQSGDPLLRLPTLGMRSLKDVKTLEELAGEFRKTISGDAREAPANAARGAERMLVIGGVVHIMDVEPAIAVMTSDHAGRTVSAHLVNAGHSTDTFRIDREADARRYAEELARRFGTELKWGVPPVAVLLPEAVALDERPHLAGGSARLITAPTRWPGFEELSDEVLEAYLRLRRMAVPDACLRQVHDAAAALMRAVEWQAENGRRAFDHDRFAEIMRARMLPLFTRWELVERDRMPETDMDVERDLEAMRHGF